MRRDFKIPRLTGAVHLSHFADKIFKVLQCSKYSHFTSADLGTPFTKGGISSVIRMTPPLGKEELNPPSRVLQIQIPNHLCINDGQIGLADTAEDAHGVTDNETREHCRFFIFV